MLLLPVLLPSVLLLPPEGPHRQHHSNHTLQAPADCSTWGGGRRGVFLGGGGVGGGGGVMWGGGGRAGTDITFAVSNAG